MSLAGLVDYHIHTEFSDGSKPPEEYAQQAIRLGLTEYAHTDHQPLRTRSTDWHIAPHRIDEYVQSILDLRPRFPEISILLGIELEYWHNIEPEIKDLQGNYPWDICLGSVHYIGDFNFDNPQSLTTWQQSTPEKIWADYFQLIAEAAATGWYDSIAHPDLIKKFNIIPERINLQWYGDLLDAALGSGCAIEINTGGWRKPCQSAYPDLQLLVMAHQKGIPITLGSDAHTPDDMGKNLEDAVALARQAGYRSYLRFAKRTPQDTPFPNTNP